MIPINYTDIDIGKPALYGWCLSISVDVYEYVFILIKFL